MLIEINHSVCHESYVLHHGRVGVCVCVWQPSACTESTVSALSAVVQPDLTWNR